MGSWWGLLNFFLGCYFALLALILFFQEHLIFQPHTMILEQMKTQMAGSEFEPWYNLSGDYIGWKSVPRLGVAKYRCLIMHGNAGYALARSHYAPGIRATGDRNDWEFYILEYPGFGARKGKPSERSFRNAGIESFEVLRIDPRPIFLIGESLGSSVAAQVAAYSPDRVAGLLLVTPINNLKDVGWSLYPFPPLYQLFDVFLRHEFATDKALEEFDGPVAFLVAEHDEVVPMRLTDKLYAQYHGLKHMWVVPSGHNDIDFSPLNPWWGEVMNFLTAKAVFIKN